MQVFKKFAALYQNKQRYEVLKFWVFLFWKDTIFGSFLVYRNLQKLLFYLISYIANVIKLRNLWKVPVKKFIFSESTGWRPTTLLKTKILKVCYKDFYNR